MDNIAESIIIIVFCGIPVLILLIACYNSNKEIKNRLQSANESLKRQAQQDKYEISRLNLEIRDKNAEINRLKTEVNRLKNELKLHEQELENILKSNLTSMPYLAGMIADYLTYDFEILAKKLDWGNNYEREKKVKSIREIRKDAKERIEQAKIAVYQLEYLKALYPALDDVLETDYKELTFKNEIPEYDPIRNYISKEEWNLLSESEKNQLALDNYIKSHTKTNWQIGRDYELYIAYIYRSNGYEVDTFGSYMGIEDLGRDLIAKKDNKIEIVQCKYWSHEKTIHEKHIFQLFGTLVSYRIEHSLKYNNSKGVFITNIALSPMAKQVAEILKIDVNENIPLGDFPRIKCNINYDEFGIKTKIYHLPMDQQYDSVKITKNDECYAFTVAEAESKGFRRAYRWSGMK